MLFLPKVKKDDPCLKATKKVKSLVASLLAGRTERAVVSYSTRLAAEWFCIPLFT